MKAWLLFVALLAATAILACVGCGSDSGGGGQSNKWDEMKWDEGQWGA